MCRLRAEKVKRIAGDIPPAHLLGEPGGKVLVVGWGSTRGAITMAVERLQTQGFSVSYVHLRHLNPLPKNLGDLLRQFETVVVPEINLGQLSRILRAEYLVDVKSFNRVEGRMFLISDLVEGINQYL
jgi:2-oxoglutarate ferredoxin oxidoreductase subunit alpha